MTISVDKNLSTPIFRQIVQSIEQCIANASIKPGERLPPERELAATLGVARGTVTRAYTELTRKGVIESVQGRGSIVAFRSSSETGAGSAGGRKEKAEAMIRRLVDSLSALRFGFQEMKAMIDLAITEREETLASLTVAAVDCNPETLGMFERQVSLLSRVRVRKYLLEEIARDQNPGERLRDFDLLLTTSTHYPDLCSLAPVLKKRIVAVAVSPSQETILRLASVKPGQSIGVLCESRKFFSIVKNRLRDMRITGPLDALFTPRAPGALADFSAGKQVLILAPGGHASPSREEARALLAFTEQGGHTLVFDYMIERGSLAHVEERIRELLEKRQGEAGA